MNQSIIVRDGVLTINALEVRDDVVVKYIEQLGLQARPAAVLNCLQLGAHALSFASDKTGAIVLADTFKSESESAKSLLTHVSKTAEQSVAKSAETLERSIARLLGDLDKELSSKLDPANTASIIGKLRSALVEDCQKVTASVQRDLDLANPASPLACLRAELEKTQEQHFKLLNGQLGELLQELAAKAAARAERSKSTRKGNDFEAAAEDFLSMECGARKDLLRRTSTEFGLDQNLIGDFVVDINPAEAHGASVVIECKNGHKTLTSLLRELDKAMSNRGAAFGISVITESSLVTQTIVAHGDNRLIVRVPTLSDGDGWDFMALSIALECARWKTIMGRVAFGTPDVNRIKADIEAAVGIANRFAEAKKKITAGRSQLDGISDYLDEMRSDLMTILQRIRDSVCDLPDQRQAA